MKRMQTGIQFLLIVTLASSLFACKKDNKDSDGNKVTKDNISGSYKIFSITYKMGSDPVEDLMQYMDACAKDDITTLNKNNTYTVVDAGTKCNPPGDDSGSWDLPNANTFVIDGETYILKSYDGHKLWLQIVDNSSGTTEELNMTLAKQ